MRTGQNIFQAAVAAAAALMMVIGLTGCGGGAAAGDERPIIVATTTMIADLAQVLAGDDAQVVGIMKPGEDPHVYDVRPRDAQQIVRADLILMNGMNLEATLAAVIHHNASGRVVALAESPDIAPLDEAITAAPDPHAWMSVPNFKAYVRAARDALMDIDPAHAENYQQRAQAYLRELDELDGWIRAQFETVPRQQRVIVTSHDAFNYFAREYDVEVNGVIGISTEQQPGPQDLRRLEQLVRDRGVKALFIETSVTNTLNEIVRKIASATGASIGGTLYSDSLGAPGPGSEAGTYLDMMRHNTTTIVEALR